MIVDVDGKAGVVLSDPDTFTAFHVRALDADLDRIVATLGEGAETAKEGHVWIPISRLHALGERHGGADWREGCDDMIAYAKSRGWVDEERDLVLAHVEAGD
jgi:hypothetical protein